MHFGEKSKKSIFTKSEKGRHEHPADTGNASAFLPSIALASEIPSPDSLILDENGAAYPDGATINITVLTYKVAFNRNGGDTDIQAHR
ncbi:hypothetical protein [Clostridium thermosuccinogenes]|uniref:hypothetical protein n=1 Tax=Clostridium thermosuccinogenes TaxID=84032 RepID=UPI000CCC8387|nr:hypothetical protein [Pseudoclostridium thermosuccinogenes]PNT92166.1 hypothetical protein CDQ83_00875 [Pseudoclostridium thermosuccinogenes]